MITAESVIESMAKLSEQFLTFANDQTDEYNGIMDIVDSKNNDIQDKDNVLANQHKARLVQQEHERKILDANKLLNNQSRIYDNENKALKHQLDVLKKEAKTQKEQTKRNQKSIKAKEARIAKLEKGNKSDLQLQQLTTVYHKGNDQLIIWPRSMKIGIVGDEWEQTVLLYTNSRGCFVTLFLDRENEAHCSTFMNDFSGTKDQTRKLINKNTMQVPEEVAEFAKNWMYKVNVMNDGKLEPIDLICVR